MQRRSARILMSVGAVVAATTGALVITAAATPSSPGASALVPITPCRLFDTRPASDTVGTRSTPIGAGEVHTVPVWGTNGNCTIPSGATGVSLNIVAISPTASSFLTVFPADVSRPTASSLNWVAGQAPTPNGVTAQLGADGQLSFFNLAGTVHLAVDVVGYYEPVGSGATGPAGPAGPTGPQGPAGPGVDPARIIWVATSGGDFTSISEALASITDNNLANRYVIKVAPGRYIENDGLVLKQQVFIEGSGDTTIIESNGSNGQQAAVYAPNGIETGLSDLVLVSTATHGIYHDGAELTLKDVWLSQGSGASRGVLSTGGFIDARGFELTSSATSGTTVGLELSGSGVVTMHDSSVTVTGSGAASACVAIQALGPTVVLDDVELSATYCSLNNYGAEVWAGSLEFDGGEIVSGQGAGSAFGIYVASGGGTVEDVDIRSSGVFGYGIQTDSGALEVRRSYVSGGALAVFRTAGNVRLWDSQVSNGTSGMAGSCVDVIDTNFDPYTCS